MNVIGDVAGRDCILVDDIVDSGGTLCNAAEALIGHGARSVERLCHAWRAVGRGGGAHRRLADRDDDDHRQHPGDRGGAAGAANIRQITIAPLLAEAMRRISDESSVSSLFD